MPTYTRPLPIQIMFSLSPIRTLGLADAFCSFHHHPQFLLRYHRLLLLYRASPFSKKPRDIGCQSFRPIVRIHCPYLMPVFSYPEVPVEPCISRASLLLRKAQYMLDPSTCSLGEHSALPGHNSWLPDLSVWEPFGALVPRSSAFCVTNCFHGCLRSGLSMVDA